MILVTLQRIFRLRNIQTLIKLSLLQGSNKKNKGNVINHMMATCVF